MQPVNYGRYAPDLLCDEVSVLGKLLLKQDHHEWSDLPQRVEGVKRPIIPRSHPVLSLSSCCMCQYEFVCVRACVADGQTQQTTVPNVQSKPDLPNTNALVHNSTS